MSFVEGIAQRCRLWWLITHWSVRRFFMQDPRRVLRSAIARSGLSFTVFLGSLSVILALPWSLHLEPLESVFPLVLISTLAVSFYLSGLVALATMPPAEYARVLVSGKPPRRQVLILSGEVVFACQVLLSFLRCIKTEINSIYAIEAKWVRHEQMGVDRFPGDWRIDLANLQEAVARQRVDLFIDYFPMFIRWQQRVLVRILEIKILLANEMGLSVRQVCDHMLQYSPHIHENRLGKFYENLRSIDSYVRQQGANPYVIRRCFALCNQNMEIRDEARRRLALQNLLRKNKILVDRMVALSELRTTSGAIYAYVELLAEAAAGLLKSLSHQQGRSRRGPKGTAARQQKKINAANVLLRFVFRKRLVYSGFDINLMTIKLLKDAEGDIEKIAENGEEGVEDISHRCSRLAAVLDELRWSSFSIEAVGRGANEGVTDLEMALSNIGIIIEAPRMVAGILTRKKSIIVNRFRKEYGGWSGLRCVGRKYIVTHGYSRTVREALRRGLYQGSPDEKSAGDLPYVFVLFAEGDESEFFDARLMVHELRVISKNMPVAKVSMGTAETFFSFVRPDDSIMLVLGAEAYCRRRVDSGGDVSQEDADNVVCEEVQIFHSKGLKELFMNLPAREGGGLAEDTRRWVLVAENYKEFPDSNDEGSQEIKDVELYGEFIDRLDSFFVSSGLKTWSCKILVDKEESDIGDL